MNRDLHELAEWFPENAWPAIPCPVCYVGELAPIEARTVETESSIRDHGHPDFEPEWVRGYFTAHLRCQLGRCAEVVVAIGDIKIVEGAEKRDPSTGDWTQTWETHLKVTYLHPAPPLVSLVPECPELVAEQIAKAAQLVWTDPGAAANRLRLAIEALLDERGVARDQPSGSGRQVPTHARIVQLSKSEPPTAVTELEAVKWIGNQGSHEDTLTQADILEGVGILAHAIELIYDQSRERFRRRAEQINAGKGVRPRVGPA